MSKVRLGIIGYGNIGSQHGRAIRDGKTPQVDLTAVADIDEKRLELAKSIFGEHLTTFTSASELIHSGLVDAVLIAVPHYEHPSLAIEAMEAGLHVLVEKPAGVYTKQVEKMNEVAAKHPELVYCMDFNQRTNPLYIKVKDLLESGELPLEEALSAFQQGVALSKVCMTKLNTVQQEVEKIVVAADDDNEYELETFAELED